MPTYSQEKDYARTILFAHSRNDRTLSYSENKRPVIFFGCSYTYGQGIKVNNTFSSQVQKYTKRKTYNIAAMGWSFSQIYSVIRNKNFTDVIDHKKQPEFIIYTVMFDHFNRINLFDLCEYINDKYSKNKNNSFSDEVKYYLNKSYTFKLINAKRFVKKSDNLIMVQKSIIKKIINITHKLYPDSTFVILLFKDVENNGNYDILSLNTWSDISKINNVKIISTEELTDKNLADKEYKHKYDIWQNPPHPNEKAWEAIVPALVKKLEL